MKTGEAIKLCFTIKFMTMNTRLLFLLFLLFAYSCSEDKIDRSNDKDIPEQKVVEGNHLVKGLVRIKLKESAEQRVSLTSVDGKTRTGISALDELADRLGATKIERVFPPAGEFEARTRAAGLHLWYDIYFDETKPVTRAIGDLSELAEIDKVDPVRKIKRVGGVGRAIPITMSGSGIEAALPGRPNDPLLRAQWHYVNDGTVKDAVAGADINLLEAWKVTTGSPEVIVAIVDGGIDYEHEDLQDNMWVNEAEKNGAAGRDDDNNNYVDDIYGWNFVDNTATIIPHSHGTHVAGTVSAVNNNGKGLCGVAGGSGNHDGVRLMSCQIFKADPNDPNEDIGTNRTPQAIKYGADNGAVISQNSWGFVFDNKEQTYMDNATKEAIDYFIKYAGTDKNGNQVGPMKGGIVIFAAGNEDSDYKAYPAAYGPVLSVAAMAPDYRKAWYSNFADWINLTAPGGTEPMGVRYAKECMVASTGPGNEYIYMQGTSMACPHVSGIAALVVSKYGVGHPGFTPNDLRERLLAATRDIDQYNAGYRGKMGVGYIDAALALQEDRGIAPEPVADLAITWGAASVLLKWSVTSDEDNGTPDRYDIYVKTQSFDNMDLSGIEPTKSIDVSRMKLGDEVSVRIQGLIPETRYYVAVVGVDRFGNRSAYTVEGGETVTNAAPVVVWRNPTDIVLKAFETARIYFDVTDPEDQVWEYRLESTPDGVSVGREENTVIVTIVAPEITAGVKTPLQLIVTNEGGSSETVEIPYEILPNRTPEIVGTVTFENLYFGKVGETQTIDLNTYFRDPDGENLKYTATCSSNGLVSISVSNNQLVLKSLRTGLGKLTITATDHLGATANIVVDILVRDDSRMADFYPNPVRDELNIQMGKEVKGNIEVKLYNTNGVLVLETGKEIAPFKPAKLDVTKLPGGSYVVVVKYNGKEYKNNIVKL